MARKQYGESISQYFELLKLIPKHPAQATASELQAKLSERLGTTADKRWVERALKTLSQQFPIRRNDKGTPYGWCWLQGATLDIPGLTLREAQTLALVKQQLAPLLPPAHLETLQAIFGHAEEKLRNNQARHPGQRHWQDKIRTLPAWQPLLPPTVAPAVRDTVFEALDRGKQLRASYQKPWQDEPVEYTLHPLALVQRGVSIYLVCTFDGYDDPRVVALHRIQTAQRLDDPADRPPDFNLDQAIDDGLFGMGGSLEPIRLVARFYKPVAQHLLDTPLSEDQQVEDVDTHHLRLTATVLHTTQLEWWLRSFGAEVEVLEPAELREAMAEQTRWLARKYLEKPLEPETGEPE
ncbi:MAG: WYL domain-containing protein [Methylococcus sp.]|nr:WYL domain-containing protein [Methylococcus sp.]